MFPYLRLAARIGCALSMLACDREQSPTAPSADPTASTPPSLTTYAMAPTEAELAQMPADFRFPPSIISARTIVGFVDPEGVFAQGTMTYFGTDAEQDVSLVLRTVDREITKTTMRGTQEHFLPALRSMWTNVTLGVGGWCGHLADGHTSHRAFHKFIVGGWKFLSWGNHQKPSNDGQAQPACPEPPPPSETQSGAGRGGGDYESGCQSCQQWFWYDYGQIVDEWWECTPVEADRCDYRAT